VARARKRGPLAGRRIVITRRREQAGELRRALEARGASITVLPTIALAPPKSWRPLDEAFARLRGYDWLIFTSVNGVEQFFARMKEQRLDGRDFRAARIAAIGPATARALRRFGLRAKVVPDEFRAEGLLAALRGQRWRGKKALLARAATARDVLPRELRRRGARVDVVAVYRTVVPAASRRRAQALFTRRKADAITFTSSSTVRNFCALLGRSRAQGALKGMAIATIGPVTSRTARALGLRVDVEAKTFTVAGLVRALESFFRAR